MDASGEMQYLLELRDTTGLALAVFDEVRPAVEAWERADTAMRRPRRVGDPAGPEAFTTKVNAQRDVFLAIETFLSLWARASLLLAPSPRAQGKAAAETRAAYLLGALVMSDGHPILDRTLRDHWMHLDERLDLALAEHGEILRHRFTRSGTTTDEERRRALRLVEVDTLSVHILGDAFPLPGLRAALDDVHQRTQRAIASWGDRWPVSDEG